MWISFSLSCLGFAQLLESVCLYLFSNLQSFVIYLNTLSILPPFSLYVTLITWKLDLIIVSQISEVLCIYIFVVYFLFDIYINFYFIFNIADSSLYPLNSIYSIDRVLFVIVFSVLQLFLFFLFSTYFFWYFYLIIENLFYVCICSLNYFYDRCLKSLSDNYNLSVILLICLFFIQVDIFWFFIWQVIF